MSKTLVMTVGTGRCRQDIADAIVFCIRQHAPDKVVFFCSEKTDLETMPLIAEKLCVENTAFEAFTFENENDVQFLYQAYLVKMKNVDGLTVDFTSGTKAMSAAVFAAAIASSADHVSYVTGPRDETGRVTVSTDVDVICPDIIIAERQLETARTFFNNLDFYAAWNLADRYRRTIPKGNPLRAWAKTLYLLGKAYDLWDRFMWNEAAHILRKAANPREGLVNVDIDSLGSNAAVAHVIAEEPNCDERLVDIANNAARRLRQGRYDDALSRLYRAYEYLLQNRLINRYNINTSDVDMTKLKGLTLSDETISKLQRRSANGNRVSLAFREAMEFLAEIGDDLGNAVIKLYWKMPWQPSKKLNAANDAGPLQNWLNLRNNSFLAHGTVPAKEDTVKCMINEYERLLKEFIAPDRYNKINKATTFVSF